MPATRTSEALSALFGERLSGTRLTAARRFGLEHEFLVWSGTDLVDFAAVLPTVISDGRKLHPTQASRFRTTSGVSLQAEGKAAEIATPPVSESADAVRLVDAWARRATGELRSLLPPGLRLEGASTHLSVSVADDACRSVAHRYAHTFAPVMMLLLDRANSPGLLVRPRPGRVELCGEFVEGDQRRVATTFAIASVFALADPARDEPPTVEVGVEPAVRRFGWYVDRSAFGCDLYSDGRQALLRLTDGRHIHAQELLESCWEKARPEVEGWLDPADVDRVDRAISGDLPIPLEATTPDSLYAPEIDGSGESDFLRPRRRDGYRVGIRAATWDFAAFDIRSPTRTAIVSIPYDLRRRFLDLLDRGHLDDVFAAYLSAADSGRVLGHHEQTERAGLYDRIDPGPRLLPRDDPGKGGPDGDHTIVKPAIIQPAGAVTVTEPADEPHVALTAGTAASPTLDGDAVPGRPATLRTADTHAGSFHVGPGESPRLAQGGSGSAGDAKADRGNVETPWWRSWKFAAGTVAAVAAIAVGIAVALSGGGGVETTGTPTADNESTVTAEGTGQDGDGAPAADVNPTTEPATDTESGAGGDGATSEPVTSNDPAADDDILSGLEEGEFDFDAVTIDVVIVELMETGTATQANFALTFGAPFVLDIGAESVTLQAQLQNLEGGVVVVEIRIDDGQGRFSGIGVDDGEVSGLDDVGGGFGDGGLTATLSATLPDTFLAAEGDFFATVNILRGTEFMQSSDVIGVPHDVP